MKKVYSTPVIERHTVTANTGLCLIVSQGTDDQKPTVADSREEAEFAGNSGKNIWDSEW